MMDVNTEEVGKGRIHEILNADELVPICESIKGIPRKFASWKNSLEKA